MENMNDNEMESQYLKIVTKALSDTLLKYLLPQPVINASPLLKSQSEDFEIEPNAENVSEITEELIQHLVEDESDEAELAVELKRVLCEFHTSSKKDHIKPDGRYDAQTTSNTLIQIFNGSYLKNLSIEEASKLCTFMYEKKFITEKTSQLAVKESNTYEICLYLMKNIKPRKPNWPFEFLDYLNSTHTPKSSKEPETDKEFSSSHKLERNPQALADDLKTDAIKCLYDGPALSSKFSEYDEDFFNRQKMKEQRYMTNFSDESCDDDDDDDDDDEDEDDNANAQATMDLSLRNYQKELAKNALAGKNTIICAPTGSGKTRVATHVIIEHLKQQEATKNSKKKVAFLARTVPLVMQQFKGLKKFLPTKYKIENITGDSEYSMFLHKLLAEHDVFVMTPRILENHVQGDDPLIPGGLAAFSLLVFDECHHTRKGEAYNTLMLSYLNTKEQSPHDLPQVVGLTASIGVEKAKNIPEAEENIIKICSNLDAVSISAVKEYGKEMREQVPVPQNESFKLQERDYDETVKKILSIIKTLEARVLEHIKDVKNEELELLIKKIPQDRKSQQYGQWVVMMEKKAMTIARQPQGETNSSIRSILAVADYLKAYNVALELYDLVPWRYVLDFLTKRFTHYQERKLSLTTAEKAFYCLFQELEHLERNIKKSNENLKKLKKVIKKNLERRVQGEHTEIKVSKGIIFVRTRFIAHSLASWLERNKDPFLKNLGTSVFTGTEASEDEGGMTSTQQEEIIERFKSGDLRLLVATSVAEEGLDIPECNLVIKYNHVGNEVTTVQMRGRSRRKGGMSILLAFESIFKKELINQYDATMMEDAIKNVSSMPEEKIRRKNEENQREILKNDKIDKLVKQNAKSRFIDKDFKMVCKMCRKIVINSQDIKLIDDSHHVVANREFMDQIDKRRNKSLHIDGQMASFGYAICKGKPEKQAMCGNVLGSLMIFNKITFIVLSVKSFGFETGHSQQLVFYNSWKKVPYQIKDIQTEDIRRYLPDTMASPSKTTPESETNISEPRNATDMRNTEEEENETQKTKFSMNTTDGSITHAKIAGEEENEAQGNKNSMNTTDGSITHAKTAVQGPQLAGTVSTTDKDSGFLSNKTAEKNRSSTGDESNTYPKAAPAVSEISSTEEKEEAGAAETANLPDLLLQSASDMSSLPVPGTSLSKALFETPLSKISSFKPLIRESIETPQSSIPPCEYSSASEDESHD